MSAQSAAPTGSAGGDPLRTTLRRLWWLPVVRGVTLLVLGFLLMVQPLAGLTFLFWVFGIFAVIDGVIALAQGLANRREPGAGWWFAQAGVSVVFGAMLMVWPKDAAPP